MLKKYFFLIILILGLNNIVFAAHEGAREQDLIEKCTRLGLHRRKNVETIKPNYEESFKEILIAYENHNLNLYAPTVHSSIQNLEQSFLQERPQDADEIKQLAQRAHQMVDEESLGCIIN